MPDPAITCIGIGKRFGPTIALDDFHLDVHEGDFHTILGPSGCGKTTALRIIAGFDQPESGTVRVGSQLVAGPSLMVPSERRRVGMVFQDFALFPHLDVEANVSYARNIRPGQVARLLELVGLSGLERRMPHQLSGGQQQRVALARALAPEPRVVLLDEPFSNLDAALRSHVRDEVKEILLEAGTTALFVTHDQEEALSLSDRVSVMAEGRIVQTDRPADLYRQPESPWVASFLGEADFVRAHAEGGTALSSLGSFPTSLQGACQLMIRPENVLVFADAEGPGQVISRQFFGHDQLVSIALAGGERLRARLGPAPDFQAGERVSVKVDEAVVFPL
ncbi:MAG TPA: ABC transporter ATP-binding protein [Rubrobacter sp.]|jgi:iron(III) transport system ATP-binding protein|nr:ABC transporter ATP-binding protein [Rubrobacter sp.]